MMGLKTANEKHGARLCRGQTEGIGVEVQLQGHHRLKDEVGSHVAQAVSEFLFKGEFCACTAHRFLLAFAFVAFQEP